MTAMNFSMFGKKAFACLPLLLILAADEACCEDIGETVQQNMIFIEGGTFVMGDVFGDGKENERPTHKVTLADFSIARHEVTVGEFSGFVSETGYKTSAESPVNTDEQQQMMIKAQTEKLPPQELQKLLDRFLSFGGTFYWDTVNNYFGFSAELNWAIPGFEQTDINPVVNMSWDDAANYCNWLSKKLGFPSAYDLSTGELLDENGNATIDIGKVKGYRLPTEAEWEYAARERGKKVRFGNGQNIARSKEINFRADYGNYEYLESGKYRKKTTPVGSFTANKLGLYDMSGNAWEWCCDYYDKYSAKDQKNPYVSNGVKRVIRGGRWGGDAYAVRVFSRDAYEQNNRCNNAGFRIAKSK